MAEFQPFGVLWGDANAPYPSEPSARWAIKKLRAELVEAQAIAYHCGALMIHPHRFAQVAELAAIREASNRLNRQAA
jgi:hypothetical protein